MFTEPAHQNFVPSAQDILVLNCFGPRCLAQMILLRKGEGEEKAGSTGL